jgi:ABC-type branched-subunit amino acid transport system substrate-binding protein
MKRSWIVLIFLLCGNLIVPRTVLLAQPSTFSEKKIRIALFAPLYLDSAFDKNSEYRYGSKQFPKFIVPGLEFYEGALLALDSLRKEGAAIELIAFDNKAADKTIAEQLSSPACQGVDLIITYCSAAELKLFASAAKERKIPVININLPNDGGVLQNPYLVLLNSTLPSQCQSIYSYIRNRFSKHQLVVFQKKGALETRIRSYIEEAARKRGGTPPSIKFVELTDSFTVQQLTPWIDTLKATVCWIGSVEENFGKRISQQLVGLTKQRYKLTIVGMPTWDGIKEFSKTEYRGADIIFCTPFYSPRTDSLSQAIETFFGNQLYARPSDMVLRGYEATWRFTKLLLRYKKEVNLHLGSKEFALFRETDIQPTLFAAQPGVIQYYENKKLYYLKWQDGFLKLAN